MKVSVVVPVRNEEKALPALLDSLLGQSIPPDEIVIADGGSHDATVALAASYADRDVRVLRLGPAYPGRGRNHGVAAARNDWIAFIDAGCAAGPEWLEALTAEAGRDPDRPQAVLGTYRVRLATEWERAQALAYVPPMDVRTGCRPPFIASSLLHRDAWRAAGGFREDLRAAEDLLFFERLAAAGVPTVRAAQASVTWTLPQGPGEAYRRFRRYSGHHLAAGLFRTWHRRVMAMDLVALLLIVCAFSWPWAALLLVPATLLRLVSTIGPRRSNISPLSALRPDRLLRVAWLLVIADLATWMGALDFMLGRAGPALEGGTPRP